MPACSWSSEALLSWCAATLAGFFFSKSRTPRRTEAESAPSRTKALHCTKRLEPLKTRTQESLNSAGFFSIAESPYCGQLVEVAAVAVDGVSGVVLLVPEDHCRTMIPGLASGTWSVGVVGPVTCSGVDAESLTTFWTVNFFN